VGRVYNFRRSLAGILAAVFFAIALLMMPTYGSELDEMREKQKEVKQEIERTKQKLQEAKEEQRTIFGQLKNLNDTIEETTAQLETIRERLRLTEAAIEKTERELKEAEARLQERVEILSVRLKEIYQQGNVDYLEVLLEATSFRDFLVRFHLLEKIAEQDMQLVDEIEAERQKIANKKADLEVKRQELAGLERETRLKREELEQKKVEKEQLLAALETEKATIERALKELEQASNIIAAKIRAIQARNANKGNRFGGKLSWPTPGYTFITSDYGWRVHPILGIRRLHTGIDIGAPMGANVYSAGSGVVIFTGWLGAYGNAIVIDHGDGISTLYAHLSRISVREGQEVGNQEKIGDVGSTGWSTGPHLHFEVRVNGEPVNPWGYVR